MNPTVSVIIPNHNYARTLRRCLESVYAQTHPPDEVIVVDDRSTDDSRDIARGFPCRLIENTVNGGVSVSRNAGAAAATGDVLFFLDSDEALAPDALANAVDILDRHPEIGCVHGLIAPEPLIDDGPVEWYRTLHSYWWRRRAVGLGQTAFFAQAAIRRSVFEAAGPFDESLRDSEDLEYSERLAPITRILLTERIVAAHDEVSRLGPLLAEQFRRSQLLARTVFGARRKGRASLTANRPLGILAVAAATASTPLAVLRPPVAALTALLLAVFALADPGQLRLVARYKGARFVPFFLGVSLLVHLALLAGAAVGVLRTVLRRRWLTPLVVLAALAGLGFALRRDGPAALAVLARPEALPLCLAAVSANLAGLLIGMLAWRVLVPIGGLTAGRIFFLGQLGKYLPGRVWGVVTHVDLGRRSGVPAEQMVTAYLVSIALTIVSGALVGLLATPGWWIAVPVAGLAVCLVRPQLLNRVIARVARLAKRSVTPVPPGRMRLAVSLALLSWLVSGLHLWAVAVLLGADPGSSAAVSIGAFALATVAGSLSIIAPDGWGVREVAISTALATVLPWSAAGMAAVASRLVCVLVEVTVSLLVVALSRTVRSGDRHVQAVHP
ncbi:glycosyltransferase [Micromonospora sp. DT178]|uniref:glycosyltransferase family 2 protein n=1 Tax=Micromonospora sp. DT178 TaxID=3393436 RepID=UPI003CEDC604